MVKATGMVSKELILSYLYQCIKFFNLEKEFLSAPVPMAVDGLQ
jgi:hypothetical protein